MKSSTVAINSALNVAYDRFHKFVRAYDDGDTTRERLSNNIYALRNNIASLSQKAETKTAREKIERFVKMCDTRLQLLAKGGNLDETQKAIKCYDYESATQIYFN